MTGKSCTTQLLSVYDTVVKHLDEGKQTDIIILKKLGFSGKLLLWITDYLKDRSQRVVLNGSTSEWLPVTSGVPRDQYLVHYCFYSS